MFAEELRGTHHPHSTSDPQVIEDVDEHVISEKETAHNITHLTGLWLFLYSCVAFNVQPGLQPGGFWALLPGF